MGIIKDLDKILTIKLRSFYGKMFHPEQPQCTYDCEKNKEKIQQIIHDKIIEGKPLMIARFGSIECDVCENIKYTFYNKRSNLPFIFWKGQPNFINPYLIPLFKNNAGFFPVDDLSSLKKFYKLMQQCMKEVDILLSWRKNEKCFSVELQNCIKVDRERATPLLTNKPWTLALKNKKVLVVHPFAETIINQYKIIDEVFPDCTILPKFDLKVVKAIQSAGGNETNFKDWFEALEYMKKEIDKIDYDICLLGCGAYGFPLAAHCKRMNKQAIHLGGVLQLLFGIKGKRWETDPGYINDYPYAATYYNRYWVRASSNETPTKAKYVENGCYW